jgi:hypothetical protein
MRLRALRLLLGALVVVAGACASFVLVRPVVEGEARDRVERAARAAGLATTIGSVRLTPWLTLELRDVVLERPGRVRLMARSATVSPRLSLSALPGRAASVSIEGASVELPAGVRLELAPSVWAVESGSRALRVRHLAPGERLEVDVRRGPPGHEALEVRAANVRLSRLVRILLHGCPIADPGTVDGDARIALAPEDAVEVAVRGKARGIAVAAWATGSAEGCDESMGVPTDAELEAEARLETRSGTLRAERVRLAAGGAEVQARLAVRGGVAAPHVELEARVPRVDFARLLATAGLDLPAEDLGWASLTVSVSGPLLDPAALRVEDALEFNPPARPLPSIERLKGSFDHRAQSRDGQTTLVRVAPESPDFVPLADVPPLLVRTLLIGEDANFYGHGGVDLKEVPVALARNLARGTFASGASTIPQQLAKNLFLSREKTVSRKLEELALALLLDSTLGKDRVLEIYFNVIEWGPRLYGLRPAASHYFGREPGELSPKQMAFLVALVPGPLKYQRSFAGGVPTPFLDGRMATLLARLHETGALTEEEYLTALDDPLELRVDGARDMPAVAGAGAGFLLAIPGAGPGGAGGHTAPPGG